MSEERQPGKPLAHSTDHCPCYIKERGDKIMVEYLGSQSENPEAAKDAISGGREIWGCSCLQRLMP